MESDTGGKALGTGLEAGRGERAASRSRRRWVFGAVAAMMTVHVLMLAWGAWRHSPTWDEVGALSAGVSHWRFGEFDLYPTNPPLIRVVAAVPVALAGPETDWEGFSRRGDLGPTQRIGRQFIEANGQRSFWLFTLARWACIPFSLLGGYICFRWARQLYGAGSGLLALGLWCFSPNVIGNAQLITPDVGATALGVTAAYVFWHWLKSPTWWLTCGVGILLGMLELAKMTWLVAFPLWPLLWMIWNWQAQPDWTRRIWLREGGKLVLILVIGLYVLNAGYGFEGSLRKLGSFSFSSKTLGGEEKDKGPGRKGRNRFRGTLLGSIPVPLPETYIYGIDRQKFDFEGKLWSYLRGEWRRSGWWYYYIYALAIKVPLGTWVLVGLAVFVSFRHPLYKVPWRDELMLFAPLLVVLTLVSSQTGFNHHMRYVLPIFPFAFIWLGKLARAVDLRHWKIVSIGGIALLWSVTSSLWTYPHSLSYFNELVGGPVGGHAHLVNSNVDWGQDLLYLKRWLDDHPEVENLGLAYFIPLVDPAIAGIEYTSPPPGPAAEEAATADPTEVGPLPGWYALSVNRMRSRSGQFAYFLRFRPVAMAGYSIYIYHITWEEANRVRLEMGLEELPGPEPSQPGGVSGQ